MFRDIKRGDIVFTYKSKDLVSKLIYLISKIGIKINRKKKVSHVALYIGNDLIIEADWKGISVNHINKYEKDFEIHIGKIGPDFNTNKLIKECIKDVGKVKYAYLQLIVLFLKKILRLTKSTDTGKKQMICSEFVVNKYKKVGVDLVDINEWECTPLDLLQSNKILIERVK